MGHRLSKIYTRTGDAGTTGLGTGDRVSKDNDRVEAIGTIDELNSVLGILLTEGISGSIGSELLQIQHELFDIGGELCVPGRHVVSKSKVERLETVLDRVNALLPPLKEFILPGGTRPAAITHLARTVCRRAERRVITLASHEAVNPETIRYLNRLSDLLFVLARELNRDAQRSDVLWQPTRPD